MKRLLRARRAPVVLALAMFAALAVTAVALADNFDFAAEDNDGLVTNNGQTKALGNVAPGEVVNADAVFTARCTGNSHLAAGQQVLATYNADESTKPAGGSIAATNVSFTRANRVETPSNPAAWPNSGNNCPSGTQQLARGISDIQLTAPATPGDYTFTVKYATTLSPNTGATSVVSAFNKQPVFTYTMTVVAPSDTTAPTSSASATKADTTAYTFGDWTNQNVTVTLSGQDDAGGSGLKEIRYTTDGTTPSASAGTVYGSPFTVSAEGTTTVKFVAVDNLGNVESPVNSRTVKIDKAAPSVNCGSADADWHAADVSIACTSSDGPSGLSNSADAAFNLVTSVASGTETSNASTDSRTVTDNAGNSSTAGPIGGNKVDKRAPEVNCGSADADWHAADVSIACTATDGGSGVNPSGDEAFSLATNVAAGSETSNALTATKAVADAVGNTTTAGPIGGNKVDKKGPSVTCATPAPSFLLNQSPAQVSGTATDGGSGPASQSASGNADTSSVGTRTATVSAADAVGNPGQASCSYSVVYGFQGLAAPVDRPNTMNVSRAGQAIPLKWRLVDANGGPVTNLTTVTVQVGTLACAAGATTDQIEEYAAGASGLQNLGDGYYQFNWKTPTSYAGSCKSLSLSFGAGGTQSNLAHFTFKR